MVDFPDVYCYIKLLNRDTNKAFNSGKEWDDNEAQQGVTVRYVVVNDSKMPTGTFVVTGALSKDSVKINPNPVPGLQLSLASKQVWTHEHIVNNPKPNSAGYKASILGDIGGIIPVEETEENNKATATFSFDNSGGPK